MKTKPQHKLAGLIILGMLLSHSSSFGQYTQSATNTMAPGANLVEKSATVMTFATFKEAVGLAWTNNSGGVLNFPTSIPNPTTALRGNYGTNGSRMQITSSVNLQNITSSAASFTVLSTPNGTTSTSDQSNYLLTLGLSNTNSGLPLVDEVIKQIGFVVLSRNNAAGYPLDLRATATFSDNSIQAVTAAIALGSGTDDTFFGFTAPEGQSISSVRLQSFMPNTETPIANRIGWDDFGFITGASTATPPPIINNVRPAAYSIIAATNGIHFEALTYVNVDSTNISLVVNGTDVFSQLVFTGSPTNYSVAYNGLLPDQEYAITISVTNPVGVATLSRTFYTATSSFVLYDSQSFVDDTLYPLGSLTGVTHGRATWIPHLTEPAQIVEVGGTQGKVLERPSTGASRADFLSFPPVSSGTITMEFDTFVSSTVGRTIDICLQPTTGGTAMGSFLAWGEITGKLTYFDNVNWLPISDLQSDWHHVKIVNYLSGTAAGRYDVFVNGVEVGQKLRWRNAVVGSAFNQFRIQTQNTAALFEYGRLDNLVITAAPEDPNAVLPPTIVNVTPADGAIIRPQDGIHFEVDSLLPITGTNVTMTLNGAPVALTITGTSNHLFASYTSLNAGNQVVEIQATNPEGVTTLNFSFIATDEAWLVHPSDGWVAPWQWNGGTPQLQSTLPLDGAGPYIRHGSSGGLRNAMREYQSGLVNINESHYIRWKFRLFDPDFENSFSVFNDRVHFFAHPVNRLGGSTTTGNSWAILAAGGPSGDAIGGKTFWVFDNVQGNGTFNLANHVDTLLPVVPDHIYSFEVLVHPQDMTYSVKIVDETSAASFTSSAPHKFRDLSGATHTFLHFGLQASAGTDVRSFDLDSVSVVQGMVRVKLLDPQLTGNAFSFAFATQAGTTNVVQYRDSFSIGNWETLQTIMGDGKTKVVTNSNPTSAARFYRVITE